MEGGRSQGNGVTVIVKHSVLIPINNIQGNGVGTNFRPFDGVWREIDGKPAR